MEDAFAQVAQAANAAAQLAAPAVEGATSYKYTKKLMGEQDKYNMKYWNLNNERQDYLMQNADLIRKQSLKAAGYGTADPNGTGTTPVSPTASPMSAPSGSIGSGSFSPDFTGPLLAIAQARKTESETALNNEELKYRSKLLGLQADNAAQDLKQKKDTLPLLLDQYKANIDTMVSQKELNEKEANVAIESANKLIEETNKIRIESGWIDKLNAQSVKESNSRIKLNFRNARKALYEGNYQKVCSELAECGIIVGADWFTQLAAIAHQGSGSQLVHEISDTLREVLSTAFDEASSQGEEFVSSFIDQLDEWTGWFTNDDDYTPVGDYYVDRSGDVFTRKGKHYYKSKKTLEDIR